jgi:L,D-transpeptidase ErfK/SrfK
VKKSFNILILVLFYIFNYIINSFALEDLIGQTTYYKIKKDDTLISVARKHNLAFPEIMLANSSLKDPWLPELGKNIILPTRHVLPDHKKEGIIINKGDLRVYYFSKDGSIYSYPIGIGRREWETPDGIATVVGKKKNPYWTVPKSILEEEPHWPKVVKPGPDNPLGTRAIYLSMPGYLLHGTNKPWGVGMKVSHGCIRLYPEAIEAIYELVDTGEKVVIVDQPIKVGWQGGVLYLEVHITHPYGLEEGEILKSNMRLLPQTAKVIQKKAANVIENIDWAKVTMIVKEASGKPEAILSIYK